MVKKLVSYDTDTGELSSDVEADLAQRFGEKLTKADADATYAPVSEVPAAYQQYVAANASGMQSSVNDAVGEWWIWPLATYDAKRNRTIGGGLSGDRGDGRANVVVWERNHGTGKVHRYVIGDAPVDDHNVPSVLLLPDGRVLVTWNYHAVDQNHRAKVSNLAGDLRTLVYATEHVFALGFDVSYSQCFHIKHLSEGANHVVWSFVRVYRGDGFAWEIIPLTINKTTGAVTKGAQLRCILGGTNQAYCSIQDAYTESGNQKLRLVGGYNPAAARHELHALEIDVVSGAVTSFGDPSWSGNVTTPTNMPYDMQTRTPAIPEVPANHSRRLFYCRPGPDTWALLYADWNKDAPDAAKYTLAELASLGGTDKGLSFNAGYADTPDSTLYDPILPGIFVKAIGVKLPTGLPTAEKEFGRRYVTATDWQFAFRVTTSGFLKVRLNRAGNNGNDYTSTVAVPNIATQKVSVGFRWRHNGTNGLLEFLHSTDSGTTWTVLDSVATGVYTTLSETSAPLVVGSNIASFQHPMTIEKFLVGTWDGSASTTIAGVDWTTAPAGATTRVGAGGETWTLAGDAKILSTSATWTIREIATSGPRVGYTNLANYIGGAGFRCPSYPGDPVLVARKDAAAGKSFVEEYYRNGSTWEREVLDETSEYYFMRPSRPVNGGPLRSVHTEITNYTDTFTEYRGNLRTA